MSKGWKKLTRATIDQEEVWVNLDQAAWVQQTPDGAAISFNGDSVDVRVGENADDIVGTPSPPIGQAGIQKQVV